MAQVRVRWLQRVNGRFPDEQETVERTDYIDALVSQKRLEILSAFHPTTKDFLESLGPESRPIVGVFTNGFADEPVLDETTNDLGQKLDPNLVDLAAVLNEPVPKPRAPRRKASVEGTQD